MLVGVSRRSTVASDRGPVVQPARGCAAAAVAGVSEQRRSPSGCCRRRWRAASATPLERRRSRPMSRTGRRVGERADRDEVGARPRRRRRPSSSVHAAGHLDSGHAGRRTRHPGDARATSVGVMLSSITTVGAGGDRLARPASRLSHSTSTMRPGHRSPGQAHRLADRQAAEMVVLDQDAVGQGARWLAPPPARTAAFSRARSPGVVLRVSRIRGAAFALGGVDVTARSGWPRPRGGPGS